MAVHFISQRGRAWELLASSPVRRKPNAWNSAILWQCVSFETDETKKGEFLFELAFKSRLISIFFNSGVRARVRICSAASDRQLRAFADLDLTDRASSTKDPVQSSF